MFSRVAFISLFIVCCNFHDARAELITPYQAKCFIQKRADSKGQVTDMSCPFIFDYANNKTSQIYRCSGSFRALSFSYAQGSKTAKGLCALMLPMFNATGQYAIGAATDSSIGSHAGNQEALLQSAVAIDENTMTAKACLLLEPGWGALAGPVCVDLQFPN